MLGADKLQAKQRGRAAATCDTRNLAKLTFVSKRLRESKSTDSLSPVVGLRLPDKVCGVAAHLAPVQDMYHA